jgi:hypothetical protein
MTTKKALQYGVQLPLKFRCRCGNKFATKRFGNNHIKLHKGIKGARGRHRLSLIRPIKTPSKIPMPVWARKRLRRMDKSTYSTLYRNKDVALIQDKKQGNIKVAWKYVPESQIQQPELAEKKKK